MDQFDGRTDDDLFADDFEPTASTAQVVQPPSNDASPLPTERIAPAPGRTAAPPKSLADSRHNKSGGQRKTRTLRNPQPTAQSSAAPRPAAPTTTLSSAEPSSQATPPALPAKAANESPQPSNGPQPQTSSRAKGPAAPAADTNRLTSGANPRTKLTDEELAAKMERMRILSAEKTRRFEQAEQDRDRHAEIYAREMEAARLRRAEEAERRRRGEDDRRRMEEERNRNRERKLKAMSTAEGGWDAGKEDQQLAQRGFRGAYGGVSRGRDSRGLRDSRHGGDAPEDDTDMYIWDDNSRGRGRGHGRGGRSGRGDRGNRGGFDGYDRSRNSRGGGDESIRTRPSEGGENSALSAADFPALPASRAQDNADSAPQVATAGPPALTKPLSPLSPGTGRWDDEVAAMDAAATKS